MNPRHRRLLFPGLLIALLIVVVVSALAKRADAAEAGPVSTMTDARITESSGLVVSREHDDLVYTVNDSGSASIVFAVQLSTGRTVGTATSTKEFFDAEALSIDSRSTLWVADTGDNNKTRKEPRLYAFAEFGANDRTVTPQRFPLVYPDGARDVEALAINPRTDEKFLLTKGLMGGEVYAVPTDLKPDQPNRVTAIDATVPGMVTDAAFTPDGTHVIARNYVKADVLDAKTWASVESISLPAAQQGETLAMEANGTFFLVGSEGASSPLNRVAFTLPTVDKPAGTQPTPSEPTKSPTEASEPGNSGFAGTTWLGAGIAVALLAGACVVVTRRR